jgi:hypothetical protein
MTIENTKWPDFPIFYGAPTYQQAKRIYWNDLKRMVPRGLVTDVSETDLRLKLYNDAEIWVVGLDKPERVEGPPWNWAFIDEIANVKPETWDEHIAPALSERLGGADLYGVPEGRNHYYRMSTYAQDGSNQPEWAYFHWRTADILPLYLGEEAAAAEIKSAKRRLDPMTFDQEYNASFVFFAGRAYHRFRPETHAATRQSYDAKAELVLVFDFNRAPGVAGIGQERGGKTRVIGEVYIEKNSTTEAVCRKIVADWGDHEGDVTCSGDPSGGARGHKQEAGSDREIIEHELRPVFGKRLDFKVKRRAPTQRARINAVNSRFEAADGTVRFLIHPLCRETVRCFDGTSLLKGGIGELDKDHDKTLTHLSDAWGYYMDVEHPVGDGDYVKFLQI